MILTTPLYNTGLLTAGISDDDLAENHAFWPKRSGLKAESAKKYLSANDLFEDEINGDKVSLS
jgi:hypothetical protein